MVGPVVVVVPPGVVVVVPPGVVVVVPPEVVVVVPPPDAEDLRDRLSERGLHDHLIPVGHDDPGELGDGALRCLQVQGLEVHERRVDGYHQEVAADHLATGLIPQRQLRRDVGLVGDAGLDLGGAEDQLILGEVEGEELPVVLSVLARHEQ